MNDAVHTHSENAPSIAHQWRATPELAYYEWKSSQGTARKEFANHSIEQYQAMFGAFLRWLSTKDIPWDRARPDHLDQFLSSKLGRKGKEAAPSTRRRYLQMLHDVYDHLRLLQIRKDNPAEPILRLSRHQDFEKPAPTILSMQLATCFIDWCLKQPTAQWHELRDLALRLAFICSGISVSELQTLEPDHLVEDGDTLAFQVRAHGYVVARCAPIASVAHEPLLQWRECLRSIAPTAQFLFPARKFANSHDHPDINAVASAEAFLIVQEAMTAIGYHRPRQGPQTLRNTFIARQIWEGKPVDRIMTWTGLRTPESVQKIAKLVPVRRDQIAPS